MRGHRLEVCVWGEGLRGGMGRGVFGWVHGGVSGEEGMWEGANG